MAAEAADRPMPDAVRRANGKKSKVRARVEHFFAEQKDRMGRFINIIGIVPKPKPSLPSPTRHTA
ncbi:hypothetical protein ACUSIJ_08955 [Pseudochelatococcus sp. B33]